MTSRWLRIVFDIGSFAKLREEVERIGCRNAFILTTPGRTRLAKQATAARDTLVNMTRSTV
jgi:hypothetical protein